MKKFYVGVKAIIHDEKRGFLLLKHNEGHYDIPGGRIDGSDDFEQTIRRELAEEVPGTELKEVKKTHRRLPFTERHRRGYKSCFTIFSR